MEDLGRLDRLPPYVFATVTALKADLRRQGEVIIDLGMGNPDLATPKHIVDKLREAALKTPNHRYSASKGITKLRMAICDWYKRRYQVELDPESEAIVTIGAKEGISHLVLAITKPGDVVLAPNPTYPIHPFLAIIAGGDLRASLWARTGLFRRPADGYPADLAQAQAADSFVPPQSDHRGGGPGFFQEGGGDRPGKSDLGHS